MCFVNALNARVSLALNRSPAIQRLEHSDVIEMRESSISTRQLFVLVLYTVVLVVRMTPCMSRFALLGCGVETLVVELVFIHTPVTNVNSPNNYFHYLPMSTRII